MSDRARAPVRVVTNDIRRLAVVRIVDGGQRARAATCAGLRRGVALTPTSATAAAIAWSPPAIPRRSGGNSRNSLRSGRPESPNIAADRPVENCAAEPPRSPPAPRLTSRRMRDHRPARRHARPRPPPPRRCRRAPSPGRRRAAETRRSRPSSAIISSARPSACSAQPPPDVVDHETTTDPSLRQSCKLNPGTTTESGRPSRRRNGVERGRARSRISRSTNTARAEPALAKLLGQQVEVLSSDGRRSSAAGEQSMASGRARKRIDIEATVPTSDRCAPGRPPRCQATPQHAGERHWGQQIRAPLIHHEHHSRPGLTRMRATSAHRRPWCRVA